MQKFTRRLFIASALALSLMSTSALAADKILASVPGLSFPFFVHMMNAFKAEIVKQGYERDRERRPGVLAQADRRYRGGHHPGRQGHRHQPERSRRHGAGAAAGGRGRHSGGHRRPPRRRRSKAFSPMSAPTTSRAARPRAISSSRCSPTAPPSSTCRASPAPARHRPQQGPAQCARRHGRQVQDRLRADRRLRPRQGPVGDRSRALRHGRAAEGDRRRQ